MQEMSSLGQCISRPELSRGLSYTAADKFPSASISIKVKECRREKCDGHKIGSASQVLGVQGKVKGFEITRRESVAKSGLSNGVWSGLGFVKKKVLNCVFKPGLGFKKKIRPVFRFQVWVRVFVCVLTCWRPFLQGKCVCGVCVCTHVLYVFFFVCKLVCLLCKCVFVDLPQAFFFCIDIFRAST